MVKSLDHDFWRGKRVFLTGHTGFKGGWATLLLEQLGAEVCGFSLAPQNDLNVYSLCNTQASLAGETFADIRDVDAVIGAVAEANPDIVLHMAAQSLVKPSYENPVTTYATNVMGTVHLLEALRLRGTPCVVVNVTSDKCYENREWVWPYRESDALGGHDPYSNSKGCAELVTSAYRSSFLTSLGIKTATARAGNVIGGGDWSANRLIPDLVRSMELKEQVVVRSPAALRPWQHVLEPVTGYLMLIEALAKEDGHQFSESFNFGPSNTSVKPVQYVAERFLSLSGPNTRPEIRPEGFHEAEILKLDSTKAQSLLGWNPLWGIDDALEKTAAWYLAHAAAEDMRSVTLSQISDYFAVS